METLVTEYLRIPLAKIRPDPTQSRTTFDHAQLEDLKRSLQERGLINPISVRKAGDLYEIIAGERRYRAAAALGWKEIDCRVYPDKTPALETELLSLVENLQRVDLNPMEEARGFKQLTESPYNQGQAEIAKAVGRSQPYVANALALLRMPPEIQDFISREIISISQGRLLAKITNVERQIDLANQAVKEGWSVRQLEQQIDNAIPPNDLSTKRRSSQTASPPNDSPFRFASNGTQVTMTAVFESTGNLDDFLQKLRTAYLVWNAERSIPASARASAAPEQKAPPAKAGGKTPTMRFPQTPEEFAELEAIGANGPGPIYAKLLGPDSFLAKAAQNHTWQDYHSQDAKEGLPKLLEALKAGGN